MTMPNASIALVLLLGGAAIGLWDISRSESQTVVVYTTSALRDALEKYLLPAFTARSGYHVSPVYVAAGQQYNRLRMSGDGPEADLFLHASPLFLEKGYAEGRVDATLLPNDDKIAGRFKSGNVSGGHAWYAFAWSPLVEVYPRDSNGTPDLAETELRFGFPHPLLSNNGIWSVLFLEHVDPAVGEHLLARTRVQPTNARANIGGVADGSFDLTLGYEAVAQFYQEQGARIAYDVPLVHGQHITTPVTFTAALIHGQRNPGADELMGFLFSDEGQAQLAAGHLRPVIDGAPQPKDALRLDEPHTFTYDWSHWKDLEATLPRYQVGS